MVRALIKKIFNKNLQYNILSLINVFIGFLFILYLGRKFGASKQTDIYFLSMTIIAYLGYFVQGIWEAMSPYYIELKVKNKKLSDELYSILLNDIIIVAFFIICLYFSVVSLGFVSEETKKFLDIFIFYLVFQNILFLNKTILNLEHFYASFYLVDIFVYFILFLTILFTKNIIFIAYATIVSTFIANVWQFYLIFKKVNIDYGFKVYDNKVKEIYLNSFKLKIGSLFYGSKDIIMASVFTSFGSGIYSLYSYANKFAGVILQVVNAPIVNVFATKSNYYVANRKYDLLKQDIKKVLSQTVTLYVFSGLITYFLLPFILKILFGNKFSDSDILSIQRIFLILSFFYMIWIIQTPYGRLISIFKLFNFTIVVDFLFFVILSLSFIFFQFFHFNYLFFLYFLVLAQFSQFSLIYRKITKKVY